jgi:hypothetical protein
MSAMAQFNIWKAINSPTFTLGFVFVIMIVLIFVLYRMLNKSLYGVIQLSELDHQGEFLQIIDDKSSSIVHTQKERMFVRNAGAYTIDWMGRIVRAYLGKLGTAYTFTPATTPKGKASRVGSLYDGVMALPSWKTEEENIKEDMIKELKDSKIFVTVDLDIGYTPEGYTQMSETDVKSEANASMMGMVGEGIREEMEKRDWVTILALLGAGGFVVFVAQSLGIIGT